MRNGNHGERRKEAIRKICHTYDGSSIFTSLISIRTHGPSMSLTLRDAQTHIDNCLREPYSQLLKKRSNQKDSGTIWGSRRPLRAADWLLSSWLLRMDQDIECTQYTTPSHTMSIMSYATHGYCGRLKLSHLTFKDNLTTKTRIPRKTKNVRRFVVKINWVSKSRRHFPTWRIRVMEKWSKTVCTMIPNDIIRRDTTRTFVKPVLCYQR